MQAIGIDDLKQAEALLAGEKCLLEMVARGDPLLVVLDALCRIAEATGSGVHCSILLIDAEGRLRFGGGPTLPPGYGDSVDGLPLSCDLGPCGTAALLKKQVIVPDFSLDPRWHGLAWHTSAVNYGFKGCWSTPILALSGKVLGTFAMYHETSGTPTAIDDAIIDQFTHIASIAIEREEREAALKRSEAFLAQAQRLSSTGSFLWRVSNSDMTWSEQTYRIFEIDPGARITLDLISNRYHPDDLPFFHDWLERAQRGVRDLEAEFRLRMPAGSVKYVHMVAHATRNANGELEYVGAVQDVTERRMSEDALNKVRSELAQVGRVTTLGALTASIAHEVNQPLASIVTNASTSLHMLADDPPDIDGARDRARCAIRDANRAAEVISRLRAMFGKKTPSRECVDLNEATREVIALSSNEFQRERVTVRTELADDLPPVQGDRVQLQQVVLNLLLNAVEAMIDVDDRPRQIVIKTEQEDSGGVRLSVQDSGTGFDSQNAENLFDAFYTTKSTGMGIGLSVSRSIIESHHGRLWAVCNDGPGATFGFSLLGGRC